MTTNKGILKLPEIDSWQVNQLLKVFRHIRAYWLRFSLLLAVILLALHPATRAASITSLFEAIVNVGSFVAATLLLIYLTERLFKVDLSSIMRKHTVWQIPIAAALGAIPGCGGAVVVVSQYCRGVVSFGALVAALTTTMGDAAFLLLAQRPQVAALVIIIQFAAGLATGYLCDFFANKSTSAKLATPGASPVLAAPADQGTSSAPSASIATDSPASEQSSFKHSLRFDCNNNAIVKYSWLMIMAVGLVFGVASAMQLSVADLLPSTLATPTLVALIHLILAIATLVCMLLWVLQPQQSNPMKNDVCNATSRSANVLQRVVNDTNFIITWVVIAFLLFNLLSDTLGIDFTALLQQGAIFIPFAAILMGFIPGCGPQIITTSLYLTGSIPLSAQIGNAIANDGDALFPAIALAPKQAIYATLISTIPALIIAYSWLVLFE